ncbi:MAG: endonuclease III domain-containing protein [Candidatus Helarchaeota archaeon]
MLQRTRAEQVESVYNIFTSKYSNYKEASKNPTELLEIFTPLGLNWRNQKLVELIKVLSEQEIPSNKKELMSLPGVGHYIANAYLSLHCNKKAPIIDSNAVRLWSRVLGFIPPKETHKKKMVP